jgi:hypothetical protein
MNIFHNSPKPSLLSMFIFGVTEITPTIILYTVLLILISPGMKDFVKRFRFLPNIISLRKKINPFIIIEFIFVFIHFYFF